MGHGEWNDALNELGRRGKGESVWLATAMCYACLLMEELARRIGDPAAAAEMRSYYEAMKRQINAVAWDGQWYVYAFSDDGTPVGSRGNRQGKIHLNVQTWAIFTGVAEGQRLKTLLKQIDRRDTELGPILLYPCYKGYDRRIGRITGIIPSAFENGAIYTHGAAFKMRADCAIGRADKALETFRKVLPINPHNPPDRSTLEPFGLSNFHCGPENKPNFGKALYSFLSGSGNWLYTTALEHLLGIESDYDGLRIHPLLPRKWQGFQMRRIFRGATYQIQVHRQPGRTRMRITCDGKTLPGNLVPAFADGKTHRVNVAVPTGR
jgi:cellobiose phosphorylase